MASPMIDAAKAVLDELNGNAWSESFTAERSYADWDLDLEDFTLHVDVVLAAAAVEIELSDREGSLDYVVPIQVVIRKRFGVDDRTNGKLNVTEIDSLVQLFDDIFDFFTVDRFSGYPAIIWKETRVITASERRSLRENSQYTGVIELRFDAHKAAS